MKWPPTLWYRRFTHNGDLHLDIKNDYIAVWVHIDAFHGDRSRNNAAIDRLRAEVEHDLQQQLPPHRGLDWRKAAPHGGNQVCATLGDGGIFRNSPSDDAQWLVASAATWLQVLKKHEIPDLTHGL